jgi:hypothetical protein
MKKYLFAVLFLLSSCSFFISKVEESDSRNKSSNPQFINLVFSHNISGETHPCGCRHFPLGGLPQVAGLFHSLSSNTELFYVDTGDTFFPSSAIPESMKDSLSFAANNLALGLDQIGLKYFVPGDQDFAMGLEFLQNLANTRNFKFLISNLKNENTIKHDRFAVISKGKSKIFLLGLVNPEAFNGKNAELFSDPGAILPELLKELNQAGYEHTNDFHRLVVLSHAGIDLDESLAKKYPYIDWIIGAHSQSFLRLSRDVEDTKIVQVLSKNHYVGDITLDMNAKKQSDSYAIHEIRDELEQKLNPNPFRKFIDEHKSKMNALQIKEQSKMGIGVDTPKSHSTKKYKTAQSCVECHKPQVEFWQETPHSIAYVTLMNSKEQNNLRCIKCHSLGLGDPKGFSAAKSMISFKGKPIIDYWNQIHALSSEVKSVRKLSASEIKAINKSWTEIDKKSSIKHNFANVQCLNCHIQHDEHPFNPDAPTSKDQRLVQIKNKCITCHTGEQSPEWYGKDEKTLNEKVFSQKLKKMSCPSL